MFRPAWPSLLDLQPERKLNLFVVVFHGDPKIAERLVIAMMFRKMAEHLKRILPRGRDVWKFSALMVGYWVAAISDVEVKDWHAGTNERVAGERQS